MTGNMFMMGRFDQMSWCDHEESVTQTIHIRRLKVNQPFEAGVSERQVDRVLAASIDT
jgi:hypothetical protein